MDTIIVLSVPLYNRSDSSLSDAFKSDLLASFNAANDYASFDGTSTRGNEGRWLGYKHTSTHGQALVLYGNSLFYANVVSSVEVQVYQIV